MDQLFLKATTRLMAAILFGKRARYQNHIPVVPHKAVAEVSKIGNLPIGELGCCESGMAKRIH